MPAVGATLRLFVAVDLTPGLRTAVGNAIALGRPLAPRARWVAVDAAHVTLAFLGSVTAERVPRIADALGHAVARLHPFEATLTGVGTFGRPASPRLLWLGFGTGVPAFTTLQAAIADALAAIGFAPEDRPFHPHVTLARARDPRGDRGLARAATAIEPPGATSMHVEAVVLFQSHQTPTGAQYRPLARAALAASPPR